MSSHHPNVPNRLIFELAEDTKFLVGITKLSSEGRNTYFVYFYSIIHHDMADKRMMTYRMISAYRAIAHYGIVRLPPVFTEETQYVEIGLGNVSRQEQRSQLEHWNVHAANPEGHRCLEEIRNKEKAPRQQSRMSDTAPEPTKKPAATKKNKKTVAAASDTPAVSATSTTRLTRQGTASIISAQDDSNITESAIPLPPSPKAEQEVTRKDILSSLAFGKDFVDDEDAMNEKYVPGAPLKGAATPSMSMKQFGVMVNNLLSPQPSDILDKQPGQSPSKKRTRSKDQNDTEGKLDEEDGYKEGDEEDDIFSDLEDGRFQAQLAAATQLSLGHAFETKIEEEQEQEEAKKEDIGWDQAHMKTRNIHVVDTDPPLTIGTMLDRPDLRLDIVTDETAPHPAADITTATRIVGTADQAIAGPDHRDADIHRLQTTIIIADLLPLTTIAVAGLLQRKDIETDPIEETILAPTKTIRASSQRSSETSKPPQILRPEVKPVIKSKPLTVKRQSIIPPVEPDVNPAPALDNPHGKAPKKFGGLYHGGVTNPNRPRDRDPRNALVVGLYGDNSPQALQKALIEATAAEIMGDEATRFEAGPLTTKGNGLSHYYILYGPDNALNFLQKSQVLRKDRRTFTYQRYNGLTIIGTHIATIAGLTYIETDAFAGDDESEFDISNLMTTAQGTNHRVQEVERQVIPAVAALLKVKKIVNAISVSLPEITDEEEEDPDTKAKAHAVRVTKFFQKMLDSIHIVPTRLSNPKVPKRQLGWAVHINLQDALPILGDSIRDHFKGKQVVTSTHTTGHFLADYLECQCCGATDHITVACKWQHYNGWLGATPSSLNQIYRERDNEAVGSRAPSEGRGSSTPAQGAPAGFQTVRGGGRGGRGNRGGRGGQGKK
ncbi:hypothetical protein C8J56DRAFT_891196 [Mycena floridula]|nr:hypothetical protein C8J56DRAFT_891196 [Mycena floridula]